MTSPSLIATRSLQLPSLLRGQHGWIGVDIGSAATKIVQLRRATGELRFSAHWLIDDYPAGLLTKEAFAGGKCLSFQSRLTAARSAFHRRRAAVTLPIGLTQLRNMELPSGTDSELRSMVHEELQAERTDDGAEICFDYLPTPRADNAEGELMGLSVVAVSKQIALGAAQSLRAAGLDCEVLDSLPCAISRAVRLCVPDESPSSIAALDVGYSSALFVLARDGQPLFTRPLRGWGLQALLKPLQDGLDVSEADAAHLLTRNPQCAASPAMAGLARKAQAMVAEPLSHFVAEVKRTLDFIDLQYRSIVPKQFLLLGCGALVPGLPDMLAAETGLPARPWSMPSSGNEPARPEEALFGVAAALSSLAWESASCM